MKRKTTTVSALWKFITRQYLTPKEINKIDDLFLNIKIILITIAIVIVLFWVLNSSGCNFINNTYFKNSNI